MVTKWQVVAPNGRNLTINTGGYGDIRLKHGDISRNEKAAKLFPQYFIPIYEPVKAPPVVKEKVIEPTKKTLEEQLLNENETKETKPQMLTEVPKTKEVEVEEKEESVEPGEILLTEKKKTSKKRK